MIKAVFFDWFNTLAHFDPPRESLHSQAFLEIGIKVPPEQLTRGLQIADRTWFAENTKSRIENRSPLEQLELGMRYEETLLSEAGIKPPQKEALTRVMKRVQELYKNITFKLFDDVLPTMNDLKKRNLILGLLTNVAQDMGPVCRKLGLEPYLDFVITSQEAGADKPQPPIFLAGLKRAGINPAEAIHVGDQYQIDVLGARGVGISPILLDRFDLYPNITDCPRIRALSEIAGHI